MPVVIVVGIQWGDEGKGKVVDYLTERASLVVRFQGGNNAGHTVVVDGKKTALRLIPSGILRPGTRCLLAAGVVVDPEAFLVETDSLHELKVNVTPERLGIAGEVQLILPYHREIDKAREEFLKAAKIGTTGKGIGPAYEDTVSRLGIRLVDLFDEKALRGIVDRNIALKNRYLRGVLESETEFAAPMLYDMLNACAKRLQPFMTDVSIEVNEAIKQNRFMVFEGAQGSLLDINHGTYPYVTSSNTVAGFACASAGFSPKHVDSIVGICKAYSTRVGSGPFPTEDTGDIGEILRSKGNEFGTVTGRPRRCGWFDVVAVRKAVRLNGVDSLILTKLDVLSGLQTIKLGTAYKVGSRTMSDLSLLGREFENVQPIYEELPGWKEDLSSVRRLQDLPNAAKAVMKRIEELVGCKIGGFSVGPERDQTVVTDEALRKFASC